MTFPIATGRLLPIVWLGLALVLSAALTACGGSDVQDAAAGAPTPAPTASPSPGLEPTPVQEATPTTEPASAVNVDVTPTPTPHPVAVGSETLPPAPIGLEALVDAGEADGPVPVSMRIADIGVVDAGVISVGVNADQSLEVPPAEQVGWYRFGPTPGDPGSAVLAAHIAYDGIDGVFRHLVDAEVGAIVEVGFDDGSVQRYRITSVTDYDKERLPDSLWSLDGPSQLALITCGGAFNPEIRSYDSNTVAIAVPI